MSKRKRDDLDVEVVSKRFLAFVHALNELLDVTPENNFSTRHLSGVLEDQVVIAKVLKRMYLKGKLTWMNQYLTEKGAELALAPSKTEPSKDSPPNATTEIDSVEVLFQKSDDQTYYDLLPTTKPSHQIIAHANNWPPDLPIINSPALLKQAFTHRSYAFAMAPQQTKLILTSLHNERLEFLGDSFLNHSVTKMLFQRLPDSREGELSLFRAELIGNTTAAEFGRLYNFHEKLLLNDTAERDGVRSGQKVIADTFEAYLGALLLDDVDGARRGDKWLRSLMEPRIDRYLATRNTEEVNPLAKQKVWNHCAKQYSTIGSQSASLLVSPVDKKSMQIQYNWIDGKGGNEGGYVIACTLITPNERSEILGRGWGPNKKEAEHRAAMNAAKNLGLL